MTDARDDAMGEGGEHAGPFGRIQQLFGFGPRPEPVRAEPVAGWLEFESWDQAVFERLQRAWAALVSARASGERHDEAFWRGFFEPAELERFWWPRDDAERDAFVDRLGRTPRTDIDGGLAEEPWHLLLMVHVLCSAPVALGACRRVNDGVARLEFTVQAWPYGGAGAMRAFVEAFGCKVVEVRD